MSCGAEGLALISILTEICSAKVEEQKMKQW